MAGPHHVRIIRRYDRTCNNYTDAVLVWGGGRGEVGAGVWGLAPTIVLDSF